MNTLTPVVAALATLVLPLASPAAAAPADSVMVCTRSGHVSLSPGVTATQAKDFTFTEWGEFSNCNGPGGLSATFEHDVGTDVSSRTRSARPRILRLTRQRPVRERLRRRDPLRLPA